MGLWSFNNNKVVPAIGTRPYPNQFRAAVGHSERHTLKTRASRSVGKLLPQSSSTAPGIECLASLRLWFFFGFFFYDFNFAAKPISSKRRRRTRVGS